MEIESIIHIQWIVYCCSMMPCTPEGVGVVAVAGRQTSGQGQF